MPYLVVRIPPVSGWARGTHKREDDAAWGHARNVSFTRAELRSFTGATLPDLIAEGVRLLFVGINPGLRSVAVQGHFAPRGNRFYPALLRAGITDHLIDASAGLAPADRDYLLGRGVGITSLVDRATASADELGPAELAEGARALDGKKPATARARSPSWASAPTGPRSHASGRPRPPARGPERRPAVGGAEPERAERACVPGHARRCLPGGRAGRRHRLKGPLAFRPPPSGGPGVRPAGATTSGARSA